MALIKKVLPFAGRSFSRDFINGDFQDVLKKVLGHIYIAEHLSEYTGAKYTVKPE